ncbi:Transcriptional regulator [Bosea sp. LC85]|uniref:MurR/RpiR family transcriptional regulator n=1 Tax=Bosea sp. LC85 TaxID=1502851 RepID=UPI0004E2D6E3|nr:MurR/RpiR family transcriptional regulator [Bosea sp. LC85]KFC70772.1 Transcriptional regulator [Bosea sp. LC85]
MSSGSQTQPTDRPEFDRFVALLRERRPSLPKRLKQVADHALAHLDDMAFGSTAQIAEKAGVQASTLVRFAQALDYSGFSELQEVFRSRLRRHAADHRDRLAALRTAGAGSGGAAALLDGFTQASEASLAQLRAAVRPDQLEEAAALLARAQTIVLVGARRMFPVVSYLAYAFGKLGIRAVLVDHVGGLGLEQAALAGPGDAILAISCAPYTTATVEIAAAAHQRGIPVLALTDSPLSPLAENCDLWLDVAEADFGAFRSMAASFTLAMALAVATAEHVGASADPELAG